MTKPTVEALKQRAQEVAERAIAGVVPAYVRACERAAKYYLERLPDEDDFFAWLEGYDWADKESTP